jgi:hypothetical protein
VPADDHECRNLSDPEPLCKLGLLVGVHADHAQSVALFTGYMREDALHPACGPAAFRREEDEQRLFSHGVTLVVSAGGADQTTPGGRTTLRSAMWEWYRIGVALGVGVGIGVLAAALLARGKGWIVAAALAAAIAGFAVGLAIDDWEEAAAGAAGGALGSLGAFELVRGALRRGGTRGATIVLVALGALGVAALALIPAVGYLEALAAPVLGVRLRRRTGERYAGLRTLARD